MVVTCNDNTRSKNIMFLLQREDGHGFLVEYVLCCIALSLSIRT